MRKLLLQKAERVILTQSPYFVSLKTPYKMNRKLRMGMVGGGKDAFIGAIHRLAANMDGLIELKCGALSINPEIAVASGAELFLPKERTYLTFEEMITKEAQMPADERIDFITIVTPNFAHFAPAMMALEHGFNVVIEKPITFSLEEAKLLQQKLKETGLTLCLTHTYSGYPMVKQARAMVREGKLGKIRKVWVEYPQGWLSRLSEREGNAQAAWRTDPKKSGKSSVMGDIGTHAAHLAEYITGAKITDICAELNTLVEGRVMDDDGAVMLKFDNGAKGVLMASQVAAGEENALKIRKIAEKKFFGWPYYVANPEYPDDFDSRYSGSWADTSREVRQKQCPITGGKAEVAHHAYYRSWWGKVADNEKDVIGLAIFPLAHAVHKPENYRTIDCAHNYNNWIYPGTWDARNNLEYFKRLISCKD